MDSPVRKAQKRNDYLRHKLFRKIKRRQRNKIQQDLKIAEKELKRRLRRPKFDGGTDDNKVKVTERTYPDGTVVYFADDGKTLTPINTMDSDDMSNWTWQDLDNPRVTYTGVGNIKDPGEVKQGEGPKSGLGKLHKKLYQVSNKHLQDPIFGAYARFTDSWDNDTNPLKAIWEQPATKAAVMELAWAKGLQAANRLKNAAVNYERLGKMAPKELEEFFMSRPDLVRESNRAKQFEAAYNKFADDVVKPKYSQAIAATGREYTPEMDAAISNTPKVYEADFGPYSKWGGYYSTGGGRIMMNSRAAGTDSQLFGRHAHEVHHDYRDSLGQLQKFYPNQDIQTNGESIAQIARSGYTPGEMNALEAYQFTPQKLKLSPDLKPLWEKGATNAEIASRIYYDTGLTGKELNDAIMKMPKSKLIEYLKTNAYGQSFLKSHWTKDKEKAIREALTTVASVMPFGVAYNQKYDGGKKAGIDVTYRDAADAYDYLNSHPDASVVLDEQSVVGHAPNARQRLAKYLENAPARYIDRVMAGYLAAGIAPIAMQVIAPTAIAASDAIGGSAAGQVATKALTSPIGKSIIYGTAGATGADIAAKAVTGKTFEEWGEQDLGLPWYLSGFVNPGSYLMPAQGISSRYLNSLGRNTLDVLNQSQNGFNLKLPYTPKGYYRRAKNYLFPKKHDLNRTLGDMENYTKKAWDKERKASTIAMRLNEKMPFLFIAEGEHNVLPGGFTQQNRPISVTIDGQPIYGTVTEYSYGPGRIVFTPRFTKPQSPNTTHSISFDSPKVPIEFISKHSPNELKRFQVTNNPEFNQAIAQNISKLESESGVPVVGSSRLISEGLFGGAPGDVEMIVPKSQIQEVYRKLNFIPYRRTANDTGWTGSSEKVLTGSEPNNLDINVLGDNGTIIHQIESTRNPNKMPKAYSALAKSQQSTTDNGAIKKSAELAIPKDDGSGFYTADEYFDMIKKDPELLTQSVVDNAFKSNKDKHVGRAFVMMNSDNPGTIKKVSTAIDHMAAQIPGMKRFSQIYKSQSFDNVEKNKQILQKIGFAPMDADKFASNPEQMKNIIDYWYIRKTVGTRSVNFEPNPSGDSYENVMSAVRTYGNGDSAGGGGNTILGGTYGGFTRNHTSYSAYKPLVDENSATFDDVFAAFEREKNIWRQTDVVNNAIKEALQEVPGFSKIDINRITGYNSYRGQDTFTSRVSELVDAGKITHEQANSFVKKVAEKLGVSGLRGDRYGNVGDYFGSMQTPQNVAYRNIDSGLHNAPMLPAEFGSDDMFFLNKYLEDTYPNPDVVSRVGKMSTEDAIKLYPENIIDMRPYHQLAEAMQHAKNIGLNGAKPLYDNEILAKASGLKQARENRIDMENTYRARMWQLREKIDKYYDARRARRNALKGVAASAGPIGVATGMIAYGLHESKEGDAAYKYYLDNRKVVDQKIKKQLGIDPLDMENWDREDHNKFRRFIKYEYKRQRASAEEKHNSGKDGISDLDNKDRMTGMMKAKLAIAAHFGNPTARRMTNYDTRSFTWPGEYEYDRGIGEPKRGNVFVGSYGNLVTPWIQDTGNGLSLIDNVWSPENDQRSYLQSLKFDNENDARYFGEHYKEIAPMMGLYSSGKDIHIKPSKRGTFTAAAKKHGMSVQAYARKVLKAPKGKYSSAMRKKANFARNAARFRH